MNRNQLTHLQGGVIVQTNRWTGNTCTVIRPAGHKAEIEQLEVERREADKEWNDSIYDHWSLPPQPGEEDFAKRFKEDSKRHFEEVDRLRHVYIEADNHLDEARAYDKDEQAALPAACNIPAPVTSAATKKPCWFTKYGGTCS